MNPSIKEQLYIDHIVLVICDIYKSRVFYQKVLGPADHTDDYSIVYKIDRTKLFFVLPYGDMPENDHFNPNRIGLEHLAIGVKDLLHLKEIEQNLSQNSIENSGIHIDKHSKKEKIWLNDPDGIRLEFFTR